MDSGVDSRVDNYTLSGPHLDAVALVNAQQRHDGEAVERILATADLPDLALVLAQMVAAGVRTQGMTLPAFLDMHAEKTISHAEDGDLS